MLEPHLSRSINRIISLLLFKIDVFSKDLVRTFILNSHCLPWIFRMFWMGKIDQIKKLYIFKSKGCIRGDLKNCIQRKCRGFFSTEDLFDLRGCFYSKKKAE